MEVLERIWEFIGLFFGGILRAFERSITSLFGSSNARYVKRMQSKVDAISALEPKYEAMSEEELREQTTRFQQRLAAGETTDDLLIEAFAVCREAGKRFLGMRHYDVQMIGGMVLHSGNIAEMVTGEGKTLVATLPAYLNALAGKGVHVVTVNDYLARRDMEWMGPLYMGLGLSVGAIQSDMSVDARQKAYACDITYGTNNEFGFDYLRDNMRPAARGDDAFQKPQQQSQGRLHFAIVDEVDNILIDEARTPLIISGPAHDDITKYSKADRIARQLKRDVHFEVNEKDHSAHLNDEGVREAEKLAGVESFYTAGNMEWPHLLDNSLKAHHLYKRDVNYVIKDGKIVIVDEFTGRLMEGRQWSDGLHQSVEAKEGVKIKEESQTLATITLQNFFKLYDKICGMTGTAMTEAGEFWKIYELDVVAIPTNRVMERLEFPDVIYRTEHEKFEALADETERLNRWDVLTLKSGEELYGTIHSEQDGKLQFQVRESKQKSEFVIDELRKVERKGRPVLIGTVSIEKSERIGKMLERRGVPHEVLNAKHHKREAEIIAQAGRIGAVTIATNMAGRGTDIVLGGNAETMAWAKLQDTYATRLDVPREEWDALVDEIETRENMKAQGVEAKQLGGLHVIGTERHESRRIDLQLRGRCGRQGDPGSSRFFLSLEDDLMRIFAGEWVKNILTRMGMQEGEAIESRLVTRRIEGAQKKVEERNFEIRKNLLEYDEVMDEQRKRVYGYRQSILEGANCKSLILDMVTEQVDDHLDEYLDRNFGIESYAEWVGSKLTESYEPREFRGLDPAAAEREARDKAKRLAETHLHDAVEESLPIDEDEREWNWESLAKLVNARWDLNISDRELKKLGRHQVAETLIEKARDAIGRIDLDEGEKFLDEEFGVRFACGWIKHKFEIELNPDEVKSLDAAAFKQLVIDKARDAYDEKESEYPVMAGLYRFARGAGRIDRDELIAWARERFDVDLDLDDLKNKQREEIRLLLVEHSRSYQRLTGPALAAVKEKVSEIYSMAEEDQPLSLVVGDNGSLGSLQDWIKQNFEQELSSEQLGPLNREELQLRLTAAVEERYRPEMRRMERQVLLQLVDSAWKEHLLTMDYLRSAVGMRGYAQVDPKVEYKREGMRQFEEMWGSIGQRVTDIVFRIENLDEGFVGSTWVETAATKAQAAGASQIAQEQQEAIDGSQSQEKIEPIRNRGERVGRNDPCPCGSGKKFKNCCMRKSDVA